jgi:hypothetical protein
MGTPAIMPGGDGMRLLTDSGILAGMRTQGGSVVQANPKAQLWLLRLRAFELNRRQRRQRLLGLQRQAPLLNSVTKEGEIQSGMPIRIRREIAQPALQQGSAADNVPGGMMVESDGDLNQALQKFALGRGSGSPDILQDLVGFKELGGIKEDKAFAKKTIEIAFCRLIHGSRLDGFIDDGGQRVERRKHEHRELFPASYGDSG